jgi:hypothetical protein
MARRDVAQDRRRFGEGPIALGERRHPRLRVDAKVVRAVLLIGGEVDPRQLESVADFLKHNMGRQRTRTRRIIKFHHAH